MVFAICYGNLHLYAAMHFGTLYSAMDFFKTKQKKTKHPHLIFLVIQDKDSIN